MRSLKAFLAMLVVGAVLPGLLFGLGASWWLAQEMRRSAEQEARLLAERTADSVSEYVRLVTAAMKALAQSPALAKDDLGEAYRFAVLLSEDLGQHLGLATADGQQLFNTRRPLGAALPKRADATSYSRALKTGEPSVSNVIIGAVSGKPLVTIDVPVTAFDRPLVLGTSTDVRAIGAVLDRSPFKPGWKAAVVDGEGRFIARTVNPETWIGKMAVPEVVAVAKSQARAGSFRHQTHEGVEVLSFFTRVAGTDWLVLVGTPEPVLLAPLSGPLALLATAGATAIGLTLMMAVVLGRRLDKSARRLTEDALALGRGETLPPVSQTIREFEKVEAVLHEAARLNHERQAELAHAREAAEDSVTAKNRFIAAASHDLRQPLHASGWCIELLRQNIQDAKLVRYLEGLEQTHAAMTRLIVDLFDIARIDADGIVPNLGRVGLVELAGAVVSECRPAADEKGLSLRLHAGAEAIVVTDGEMTARILRNLVYNAIRYTNAGGVLVGVRRRLDGSLLVDVWDTGIGIPADQLDLVWEEFYQVARKGQKVGTGLGLSIVWRLAKLLGFGIEVHSVPNRGSVFRLVVPAASVMPDPVAQDVRGLAPVA